MPTASTGYGESWAWGAGHLTEPTVAQLETAAAPKAEQTGDPVTPVNDAELRAWAKGQDIDWLAEHVGPAGYTSNDVGAKIERFLDGKALHYKLRGALEQVRKDLARYNRPS